MSTRSYRGRYGRHRESLWADVVAERGQEWVDEHADELRAKLASNGRAGLLICDEGFDDASEAKRCFPRLLGLTAEQRAQGLRQMAAAVIYVPNLAGRRRTRARPNRAKRSGRSLS